MSYTPGECYTFQCRYCFMVSGVMSRNPDDAPYCCHGEPMIAVAIQQSENDPESESQLALAKAKGE